MISFQLLRRSTICVDKKYSCKKRTPQVFYLMVRMYATPPERYRRRKDFYYTDKTPEGVEKNFRYLLCNQSNEILISTIYGEEPKKVIYINSLLLVNALLNDGTLGYPAQHLLSRNY